jgi:hypothetical protein
MPTPDSRAPDVDIGHHWSLNGQFGAGRSEPGNSLVSPWESLIIVQPATVIR